MRALTLLSALLVAAPASAQQPGDFTVWPGVALAANNNGDGHMVNGVGAPAVAWDSILERYLMVFEVRLPDTDPSCPVGMWALGFATSDDPASGWSPRNRPILTPTPGTAWACVAANPTVIFNENANALHVWFKAEQTNPPDPLIGAHRYTGVGHLIVRFARGGGVRHIDVSPDLALATSQPFGMPKVIRMGDQFRMALTIQPDAYLATGSTVTGLSLGPKPVLRVQDADRDWVGDELFNASLLCDSDPSFPYAMYVGSKDTGAFGATLSGAWGKAISPTAKKWFVGTEPYFEWAGDSEWRHWDVLRIDEPGGTEYAVWFSEKDANGRNHIRFASTTDSFDGANLHNKICP